MRWTRRRLRTVTTYGIVVAWVVFYVIALANADPLPSVETAVADLVVPPLLGVVAVRLVLRHWWSAADARTSAADARTSAADARTSGSDARTSGADDGPQRLLTVAVAALPERRREWGSAMIAELAEIRGRSARWRFALSSVRAMLSLPPPVGWPVLVLATGVVVSATTAAGPAVGAAVPGLEVFAATFTGLVGAMMVLAVARLRGPRLPVPAPTLLVTGGVVASIAVTVIFLRREPAAAQYLQPAPAVYLAAVLAGCLWIGLASPRWLGTNRLAPHLGAAAAVVFAAWFLLIIHTDGTEPPLPLLLVLAVVLPLAPAAAFLVPAFVAGRAERSFRSGLHAAVWTVTAAMPLTYALWLPEGLHRHAIDGTTLDGEKVAPVGVNLTEALIFCLGIFPVLGCTLAVIGAGLGARRTHGAVPTDPS